MHTMVSHRLTSSCNSLKILFKSSKFYKIFGDIQINFEEVTRISKGELLQQDIFIFLKYNMTIQELADIIRKEEKKRDIRHEKTPANSKILKEKCGGTFEAVITGNGQEKCLIPQVGSLHFLYRGQNQEFVPCVPSLYRGNPSEAEIFIERMRLVVFQRLLNTHPVIKNFFNKHHFKVDVEGLAQHYGLKTSVLDLTSNLDIALFFATCWYDYDNDEYKYYDDDITHEAILYVFIPLLDNEPSPSIDEANYLNHNIKPIGLQAFPRPGVQEGYGLHIPKNESTKSYIYRFTFTSEDSKKYYDMFKKGESLWVKDALIKKTKQIAQMTVFSYSVFTETFRAFRPKGYSATKMKKELSDIITLRTKVDDIVFTDEEQKAIVNEWNSTIGPEMASKIYRKYWFKHDGISSDGTITGIRNRQEYRTLKKISQEQLVGFIACHDKLEGAEWKNYTNKPRSSERITQKGWQKVPASMEDLFGKPYLTKEDWYINI